MVAAHEYVYAAAISVERETRPSAGSEMALLVALAATLVAIVALVLPATAPAKRTDFDGSVRQLSDRETKRMTPASWRPGCPVPLRKLRAVRVTHVGFDGDRHRGKLVVHRRYAQGTLQAFRRLYATGFRIRRIKPIHRYGGSDRASMDADNTSAFNCRYVAGTSRWSNHAYGKAIDINPRENPYVTRSGYVSPPAGGRFVDRRPTRKGMIAKRGGAVRIFRRIVGWSWGGAWGGTKDYQHFSWNGR